MTGGTTLYLEFRQLLSQCGASIRCHAKSFTGYEYRSESITDSRSHLPLPAWTGTGVPNWESSSYYRRRLTSAPAVSDDKFVIRSFIVVDCL